MLDSLLGTQLGTAAKFAIAFLLVLGLIGVTALILKRFGGNRMPSSGGGRNRQPRLAVLDSAVVDSKRRLVLIRRDNAEHLLLIGGPSDVVVETNINRAGGMTVTADRRPRGIPQQDMDALEHALLSEPPYEEPAPQPQMRTPATRFVRQLLAEGAIGQVTWFRGEHSEDFLADPALPATWRTQGRANGAMGDLAPHIVNLALALMGPVAEVSARVQTVHRSRTGGVVDNDDQAQMMLRFASGVEGHLFVSRIATGRKMGYAYEIFGTKGGIGSIRKTRIPSGSIVPKGRTGGGVIRAS